MSAVYTTAYDSVLADADLDPGIARFVRILAGNGVETSESCEGGPGHCSPEPFIRFHGGPGAGPHALSVAMTFGLPVAELRRVWSMLGGEPTGPTWELTFKERADGVRTNLWWFALPPSALVAAGATP